MPESADVVVIGGGVIGTACAYYLAQAGLDVVLCERKDVASGASGACDGHILAIDKSPGYPTRITLESQRLLRQLAANLPCDLEMHERGSTLAVETDEDMEAAGDFVERQRQSGLSLELMDQFEFRRDAPGIADDIAGGVVCHSDSGLNPMALAFGLAEGARERGAKVRDFTGVTRIEVDRAGQVRGVQTTGGCIATERVVCAAGAWSPKLLEPLGMPLPIRPRKGHILVSERCSQPYWRNMLEFGYMMTKHGGRREVNPDMEAFGVAFVYEITGAGNFLVGSSREFVGFQSGCNHDILRLMARRAIRFFPGIADINIIRSYYGFRPYTPDHLPIVSSVRGIAGLYVAAGHEGDGITLSPVTGHLVADLVLDREPVIDPGPLSLQRFTSSNSAPDDRIR